MTFKFAPRFSKKLNSAKGAFTHELTKDAVEEAISVLVHDDVLFQRMTHFIEVARQKEPVLSDEEEVALYQPISERVTEYLIRFNKLNYIFSADIIEEIFQRIEDNSLKIR
ncbi:hypothetical protein [Aestuariispira insulae]|uniref:Uncharacterized protein n=1 Tax=Aestuariispira insulae TaxID=1461337 RepID=A0A3D9HNP6_9PROT|nr:hypothetical protein [Aestuariispira insulae]RED51089.1 hypothetical protein DFP90_104369 [Aestuariispira insulae]